MPTLAETLAQLKKRNEANAKTFETQNQANAMQFTPKQQKMIADKGYTQQSLLNKVVDVGQQKGLDGKKILNQYNVATQGTNIPNSIDPTAEGNQIKVMENDRKGFIEPDDALTDMINKTFPNLGDQLNKGYETTFGVGQDIERMLKDDLANFQGAYGPNGTIRKMLDDEISNQQRRLDEEKQLLNVQYGLANSGIDANAAESGASGGQVAASRAAANKQTLLQQADYNDRLAKFGTDKLNQYTSMQDKLNQYMQTYIQNYGNSKDKYVIDNFNNLVNLQQSLAVQIKNLEAQNLARAADAANTAALANAMGGKATSAGNLPSVDGVTGPRYTGNTGSDYIPTPLREAVEHRNPDLFKNLPAQTQQQLIQTYGSEGGALQALNTATQGATKKQDTSGITKPSNSDLVSEAIISERNAGRESMVNDLTQKIRDGQARLPILYSQLNSLQKGTYLYNLKASEINELIKALDIYNQGIINRIS